MDVLKASVKKSDSEFRVKARLRNVIVVHTSVTVAQRDALNGLALRTRSRTVSEVLSRALILFLQECPWLKPDYVSVTPEKYYDRVDGVRVSSKGWIQLHPAISDVSLGLTQDNEVVPTKIIPAQILHDRLQKIAREFDGSMSKAIHNLIIFALKTEDWQQDRLLFDFDVSRSVALPISKNALGDDKKVNKPIRLTSAQWQKVRELGLDWVRKKLAEEAVEVAPTPFEIHTLHLSISDWNRLKDRGGVDWFASEIQAECTVKDKTRPVTVNGQNVAEISIDRQRYVFAFERSALNEEQAKRLEAMVVSFLQNEACEDEGIPLPIFPLDLENDRTEFQSSTTEGADINPEELEATVRAYYVRPE